MRFTIQREAFLKPLKAVAGVVERRQGQTSPILSNVLITVHETHFSLTTTDQEVELLARGEFEEPATPGALTVPFRKLMDICRVLPEESALSLVEEQDRVIIRAGRSRFTVSPLSAAEFPNIEEISGIFQLSVSKKTLRMLIESTCFAMAEQDVRYYLNGMLLEVKGGHLYSVAADGHRLALCSINLDLSEENKTVRVIVPRKGILELQRFLDESDEVISIIIGPHHIRAVTKDLMLTSKLLDGRFPDYERIIPREGSKVMVGRRELLKDAFYRAAALFTEKFRGVRLQLTNGCLKITATNPDRVEVEEDLGVNNEGDELEIGFNVKYLIDFLSIIQTDEVKFTFSDPNSSARIESMGAEMGVYVIMPMKI